MKNIDIDTIKRISEFLDSKEDIKEDNIYAPGYFKAILEINQIISLLE